MHQRVIWTLIGLLFFGNAVHADNWPNWRGPAGTSVTGETQLPVKWSHADNVRWKVELRGAGVSTPIVWDDHIFLTGSEGRLNDQLHVYCYHRIDGKLLWHTRLFGTAPTDLYAPGGMAVPSPVTDGKHLFVLFGTGDLFCLDFAGKPVWMRSLAQEYGPFRNRWGMASSPILVENMLVVLVDHWSQSYLLAVDKKTGTNRWKTDRDATVNWSTPLAVKIKDRVELIVAGTYKVKGYDAKTGKERWVVTGLGEQCIPSPVHIGDTIFVASGEGTLAIKPDGATGILTKSHVVWRHKKNNPFIPSPLAYRGQLYVTADKGFVTCLDATTGSQLWKERMGEQYHASPVAGDGKIYFPSKEGVVRVIDAGPGFRLLAENDLGEMLLASPAISNGQIFLRGEKHLFCIGGK
jgi:outer membrane protein assembly factor BamB